MGRKGLLVEVEYCVGCYACAIACRQEHGFDENTWGICVDEKIFEEPNGHVQIDFVPYPTDLCDLCAARIGSGEDDKPACVHNCMTHCMHYGEVSELAKKLEESPKSVIYAGKNG